MNIDQFKTVVNHYLNDMINKWFNTNSMQDVICKAGAKTIVSANIDKYDSYIKYFTDQNGEVMISEFIDNLINDFQPILIDLTKYNMPFLPNKILLVSKDDILRIKSMCLNNTTSTQI